MKKTYRLEGLTCEGCARTVRKKCLSVPGIRQVSVNRQEASITVEGIVVKWLLSRALKGTRYVLGDALD